jgi:hypothetical protein
LSSKNEALNTNHSTKRRGCEGGERKRGGERGRGRRKRKRISGTHQKPSDRGWACPHLDFRLLASRTVG